MLDAIAKRYGVLPSYLVKHGDTLDLTVMDVAVSFEKHQQNKQQGKASNNYDQDDLQKAMANVRGLNEN